MRPALALAFLTALGFPMRALAQVDMGIGVGPDTFIGESGREKKTSSPLALALSLAFDATTWAEVGISTASPAEELGRMMNRGAYRLELIELILIARQSKHKIPELVLRREKGESLRRIAESFSLDFDPLYDKATEFSRRTDQRMESLWSVSVSTPASARHEGQGEKHEPQH